MTEPPRTFTRRRLLIGGAGLGAAGVASLAGWSAFGRSGSDPVSTPTPTPSWTATVPLPSPTPVPRPTPSGQLRLPGSRALNIDTFDIARSGERSLTEILSWTHSRLVAWEDTSRATMAGDLVEGWQQPAPGTLVLTLRADTAWQEREELPGRPVDTSDVRDHLQRLIDLAASGQLPQVRRAWDYASIARIDAPDDHTLVIETAKPDPFLLHTLAGPFAFIQRREAVPLLEADGNQLVTEHLSGSGPFLLDGQEANGDLLFTPWMGGHRFGRLASLRLRPASLGVEDFLERQLDEFVARDRRDAAAVQASGAEVTSHSLFEPAPLVSSFHVGSAPWRDENLRLALSAALNRYELANRLFGGRALPAGVVPPSAEAFARSASALATFPGYQASYDADLAEAQARLAAVTTLPAGPLTIDVPVIVDSLYACSAVLPPMIRDALGIDIVVRADSYVNISRRVTAGEYGHGAFATWIGWAPLVEDPDPSRALWEAYHSTSATAAEAGFLDLSLDRRLESLVAEFDIDARRALVRQVEASLLEGASGGTIPWLQQQHDVFRQPYVSAPEPDPYGLAATADAISVDTDDAVYPSDRPS